MGDNGSWTEVKWPQHSPVTKDYLTLDTNSTEIGHGPRAKQCAFWKKYIPQLLSTTGKRHFFIQNYIRV